MREKLSRFLPSFTLRGVLLVVLGNAILAFGLYNVHAQSCISEGGVLGLILLLEHHFHISPALSAFVLDAACYLFGAKVLGKDFIGYSAVAAVVFSVMYAVLERFPPLLPSFEAYPLEAALIGAVFVGVGAGLSVRAGGASGGDDAFAMALTKLTGIGISWVYLVSDLVVLGLSLTYIPVTRILYSLLTVVVSGQIIGWIQKK